MRLWSLHPRYLDPQGLVALWREALLARAVLCGNTRGYRNHPQLERFRSQAAPRSAINSYLQSIHAEAVARGYSFDRSKIGRVRIQTPVLVTIGQVQYEWHHLLQKLAARSPELFEQWRAVRAPECHPLFRLQPGPIESWERGSRSGTLGVSDETERGRSMNAKRREELLSKLEARFEENMSRHKGVEWSKVQAKLESSPEKLRSLGEMERTGGEPDVVGHDKKTGEFIFVDCSAESPTGRRSICYDREGLESRKENRPENSAIDLAVAMGIEVLTEKQYRDLQKLGCFDTKTSSWVKTPPAIRKLGGALFCDRRYDHVFVYHNGAQSYYAARGFRGALRV